MTTSQAWESRELHIAAQRSVVERRLQALEALREKYDFLSCFTPTEAYRNALSGKFRWCEPSASMRTLWTEGLLMRQYSGRGNVHFYRMTADAVPALHEDLRKRDGRRY